jgi:hypothetical protein
MRKWFERVRHVIGRSIKHAFFQEFGIHPQMGTEPRLHFHGFLFDPRMSYNAFRRIVSKFGFVWLCQATPKRARYCVKYVVKHLNTSDYEISDKLRLKLSDRKYTRKYVSPGVGDFLGSQPRPSLATSLWTFDADRKAGGYQYRIPRYYDKYLQPIEKEQKAILSACNYALYFDDVSIYREPCFNEFRASYDEALGDFGSLSTYSTILGKWVQSRSIIAIPDATIEHAFSEIPTLFVDLSTVNSPFQSTIQDNFFVNLSYSVQKKNLVNKSFATRLANR